MTSILNEADRPVAPTPSAQPEPGPRGRAVRDHFLEVHERYRTQMADVLALLGEVRAGTSSVGAARSSLHDLAMRVNDWMLGGYCQRQRHDLTEHHLIEDQGIFPHLRASDPALTPVLDRLDDEHQIIHDLLTRIDTTLIELVSQPHDLDPISALLAELDAALTSHFAYEEEQLLGGLGRHGFYAGQLGDEQQT